MSAITHRGITVILITETSIGSQGMSAAGLPAKSQLPQPRQAPPLVLGMVGTLAAASPAEAAAEVAAVAGRNSQKNI